MKLTNNSFKFSTLIKTMEYKNTKYNIYLPLIIAAAIIVGILTHKFFISNSSSAYNMQDARNYNKLDALLKIIDQNYVDKIKSDSIIEIIIPELLSELDPHSTYITKEEMQAVTESLKGNFEGIGVQFNIQNDTVLIVNIISGGPSEEVGILPGDRIIEVNDSIFAGTGITNNDVFKKLKGEKGSIVKLGIKRHGIKELLYFEIERNTIPYYSVDAAIMFDKNIGYIKINRFAGTTYAEFMEAAADLKQQGMTKMVLDLRQNGGGYLKAAVDIVDEFLEKDKLIVYTYGNARTKSEYFSTDKGICKDIELEILIDSWSASASEIVAGAIQDNDRGLIIGRRSFGKGLVQEEFGFPDSSGFRLTIARYYTPSGRCIQKPYGEDKDEYYHDIMNRASHGEMQNEDSVNLDKKKEYYTVSGKVVYGGGGIMPDIFIAADTSSYSEYLQKVTSKGYIYQFAINYTDKNRKTLNKFTNSKELSKYLEQQNVLQQFVTYASRKKITASIKDFNISKKLIETKLKSYIARNILDDDAFYKINKESDLILIKAIEEYNFK